MALQVNGNLKCGFATYSNPQLRLVPHLTYRGGVAMDVNVIIMTQRTIDEEVEEVPNQVNTIPMYPLQSELTPPSTSVDPYSDLIYSLETYVINKLTSENPGTTYTRL